MTIQTRSLFQAHPFHLVSSSPWPLNTSFSLLVITFNVVLFFQAFVKSISFILSLISFIIFYLDNFKFSAVDKIKYFQIFSFFGSLLILIVLIYSITDYLDIGYYQANSFNQIGLWKLYIILFKWIKENIPDILSNINKFVDDYLISFWETLLSCIQVSNATCSSLIVISVIQIIYKLHLNDTIKLNLTNIFGVKLNYRIEYSINKMIKLTKKMSVVFIWLIFILVIYSLSLVEVNYDISSLQTMFFKFCSINCVCLILIIILSIQIIFKSYSKDNIKLNLTSLIGENLNNIFEYYINKIIRLNKTTNINYICLIMIVVFGLSTSIHISDDILNNIYNYIIEHKAKIALYGQVYIGQHFETTACKTGALIAGTGIASAVAKAIAKSDITRLQKLAIIPASGLIAVVVYFVIISIVV